MQNLSLARKAGVVGIGGALLFIISVIMQFSLGLFGPDAGWLWIVHQLLAFISISCVMVGFLGLLWGDAVRGWFGKFAVYLYIVGWALIVSAGLFLLVTNIDDSPVFILFPIGGLFSDIGALLVGLAVLFARRWSGWQRYMPMINFVIVFFAVNLPNYFRPESGPGLYGELLMGTCWLGVALAVYTYHAPPVTSRPAAVTEY